MKSFLSVLFIAIGINLLSAQIVKQTEPIPFRPNLRNTSYCGNSQEKSRTEREREAEAFLKWQQNSNARSAAPIRTIPVVFHLLESNPAFTNEEVEQALASLNNAYAHSNNFPGGQDFSGGTRGVDTRIEFCLAQRAPDGGVTTGIVRWNTDYENMDVDLEDAKLKTQGQWDPRYYLNIWIVAHLDTEIEQSYTGSTWWDRDTGLGGYSGGPGGVVGPDAKTDGVIAAGLGAALLAHEIGHYMSLAHTFSGTCANGNCLVDGDGICDTPPDVSKVGCNQNTCGTDTLSNYSNGNFTTDVPDMTSNFMDYSSCPNEFTQGQADKMLFVIDNQRINLAVEAPSNNDACIKPCNADFSIEYAISERYPEPNVAIDFTSSVLGTGIDTYEWYVEALGSPGFDYPTAWLKGFSASVPAVGTAANLQYTFADPGKYRVYLKAWNSANPDCYASYSRIVRVTCLGIDARFTPNVRLIASKQPAAKLLDSVLFSNRSVNATAFEWMVTHQPYDGMTPALPNFTSSEKDLNHVFLEPGDYEITLIAKNGVCVDTCGPFLLPVLDPTIDGRIRINRVDCYQEDSLRVAFEIFNNGFDTIQIGMPVTFYDEDPRQATPIPTVLGTFYLDKVVYGMDWGEQFVAIVPAGQSKLDQIWAVFNDTGALTFPLAWPLEDENVMTVNSEFPATGENELRYDNNVGRKINFQFEVDLVMDNDVACNFSEVQLQASQRNGRNLNGVEWTPSANLSCTNCFDPLLTLQDLDVVQEVIMTSEYFCIDTATLAISVVKQDTPLPQISSPPDLCPGDNASDLATLATGSNLTWYPAQTSNNGSNTPPTMSTDVPGSFSHWVSETLNGCEGPKVELTYTIKSAPNQPTVAVLPNVCEGESIPDLGTVVTGSDVQWYTQEVGGTGNSLPPAANTAIAGTYRYWVSQSNGECESSRVEVSYTVIGETSPPVVASLPDVCIGSAPPDLSSLVPGSDLLWYTSETGGTASSTAPTASTGVIGTYTYWVSQTSGNCESPRVEVSYTVAPGISQPVVSAIPDICQDEKAPDLANAVTGNGLRWYATQNSDSSSSTVPIAQTDVAGTYTYWVSQSENTCESSKVAVSYSVLPMPSAPLVSGLPAICSGSDVPDLELLVTGSNLLWYTSDTKTSGNTSAPIIDAKVPGIYAYWVSQTVAGCESPKEELSYTINELPSSPQVSSRLADLCVGAEAPSLTDLVTGTDLQWYSTETGGTSASVPPTAYTDAAGTYTFWVTQSVDNCESPRAAISYNILPSPSMPQVSNIPDLCAGNPAPDLANLVQGSNLLWYTNESGGVGSDLVPSINTDNAETYSFWITQSEDNCESPRVPVGFTVHAEPDQPTLTIIPELCVGDPVPSIGKYLIGENLIWYATAESDIGITVPPLIATDEPEVYHYWVSQTVAGCESQKEPMTVVVSGIEIVPSGPHEVLEGSSQEISAMVNVVPDGEPYFVEWFDANGNIFDTDSLTTIVSPTEPTYYTVSVGVGGCIEEKDIEVDLIYLVDPAQIFSPNGDGLNETWDIGDIEKYPDADLKVYNRWGSLVYQAQQYENDWAGTWQDGKPLPVATYYYVIDLKRSGTEIVTGSVTIVR